MLDQTTGPGFASPADAVKAPPEKVVYTVCIYTGTGIEKPDYLATIDSDETSPTYGQVIHRLSMPNIGDELHHSGWNACSSCHCDSTKERKYLILPGVRTSNFYIIDTKTDPKAPSLPSPAETPRAIVRSPVTYLIPAFVTLPSISMLAVS
mgnify:CR=1 FL=1